MKIENINTIYNKINLCLKEKIDSRNLLQDINIHKKLIHNNNIKSLTLDDVFYSQSYYNCNCTNYTTSICVQSNIQKYKHTMSDRYVFIRGYIQKKTIKENLLHKNYIKIGEKCSICYEEIFHKKNAFLTKCGHAFHFSCIQTYENVHYGIDSMNDNCPICRQYTQKDNQLKYVYFESKNGLDCLEDFWNNINNSIPKKCCFYFEKGIPQNIHNVGFEKNCSKCNEYRQFGYCLPTSKGSLVFHFL